MNTEHVQLDAKAQRVKCAHCGESIPMPLGTVDWVVAVLDAFTAAHAKCKPDATGHPRKTWFAGL